MVRIPILTWHAMDVAGPDYARNDHVAFREDLETIQRLGLRVVSLAAIARHLRAGTLEALAGCVGLSMDDGSDFDFHDLPHPSWGPQRSMLNVLADFRERHGAAAQPDLHATCFTIVSSQARRELDRACMIGCGWWNDDWYRDAEASGLMAIESHSWDHNHSELAVRAAHASSGSFVLEDERDADAEIAQASREIARLRGRAEGVLLAYPYGESSGYLREDYLPRNESRHGVLAAFGTQGRPVTVSESPWEIPRYVYRWHWKEPGELEALLREVTSGDKPAARAEPSKKPNATHVAAGTDWRERLHPWEVNDARVVAGELFRRSFGHEIPAYGRHFVLVHSPAPGEGDPSVVAYVHQTPHERVHLCGGMCVDERAYRRFPRELFAQVREQGGLATIVTRDSIAMLGDSLAVFGHVGEPRARQADLRTGFVDAGPPHLMVVWRQPLDAESKRRLIEKVAALGAF